MSDVSEWNIDEVIARAVAQGVIGGAMHVSAEISDNNQERLIIKPKHPDLPPQIYQGRDAIEDYCAALMEAGI